MINLTNFLERKQRGKMIIKRLTETEDVTVTWRRRAGTLFRRGDLFYLPWRISFRRNLIGRKEYFKKKTNTRKFHKAKLINDRRAKRSGREVLIERERPIERRNHFSPTPPTALILDFRWLHFSLHPHHYHYPHHHPHCFVFSFLDVRLP